MFQFDNKEYEKLALHGGGTPMLGHYISFFEETRLLTDLKSFNVPIITSSAGSVAFMYQVVACLYPEFRIREVVCDMFACFLLQIENIIESTDQTSICSLSFIEEICRKYIPDAFFTLTFGDLTVINPNLEWTVCCTVFDLGFHHRSLGTHTPDVSVWQACLASASVPVVFPGVQINGEFLFDGDFSDWVAKNDDETILHIQPCSGGAIAAFDLRSEITLLDEAVKLIGWCFTHIVAKTKARSIFEIQIPASLTANPLSEEFLAVGRKMATMFVLK